MFIIVLVLVLMFGPPIFLTGAGRNQMDRKKAKIFYILAIVYLIIGLGICGSIFSNL